MNKHTRTDYVTLRAKVIYNFERMISDVQERLVSRQCKSHRGMRFCATLDLEDNLE